MTKEELILIYQNRLATLGQVKMDAIAMGDIDRVRATISDIEQAEAELSRLMTSDN